MKSKLTISLCLFTLAIADNLPSEDSFLYDAFPDDFMWAVASSAFQTEGAAGGRGVSVWDTFAEEDGRIFDGSDAKTACNSYEYFEKDIGALKFLNVTHYRLSISWPRVLPDGTGRASPAGVEHYKRVFAALRASNIEPVVTLFHWDLPQTLEDKGGWLSGESADWFQEYARVCFKEFGSYVKTWITINEPFMVALLGYGTGSFAPGKEGPGTLAYEAGHNLLLAHAKAYRTYAKEFKRKQNGRIGIVNSAYWHDSKSEKLSDIEAADRANHFRIGWFSEPIFGKSGDYPSIMKRRIERNSKRHQGLAESRLPRFTAQEKRQLRGSSDFYGVNYYASKTVGNQARVNLSNVHWETDLAVSEEDTQHPEGLRKILKWVKGHYDDPEVVVFDNGFSDEGGLSDTERVNHLKHRINAILKAIRLDEVNVTGYSVNAMMDSFEWIWGYSMKFGLFHVDFNTTELERMPKESAFYYSQVIRKNGFVNEVTQNNCANCLNPYLAFIVTFAFVMFVKV